jgi:Tol biopolymer transport system component
MIAVGLPVVGRISVLNRQGIQQRSISLAGVKRWISDIDWSANDLLLVVANDEQGRHTIWTVRPDGTQQTRIHVENAEISGARWARSGRAIYYHRRVEQTSSVYRLSLADHTSGQAKPTALITGLETDGSFGVSDDGRRLVYARAPYSSRLWAVDLPASGKFNARPLTGGTWRVERPRFSPDGKRLVFTVGYEARANLYIMPSDGGTPTQLTSLDGFNGGGVWSTDGRSIAFVSTSGGRPQVWRVGAEGGLPARLSPAPVSDSFALAWSSGTQILFHQPGNRNFLALDFLTGRTRPYFGDGSDGWIFSPTFSPDGRHVAVGWSRKNWGLWLIDTSDGSGRLVTKDAMLPIGWSPDGASIYVIDGKRAAYRDLTAETGETFTQVTVRRVSLSGRIEPVVDLPFGEVGGVALSPDARRLVCVVYSTGSDVWLVEPFDTLTDDR